MTTPTQTKPTAATKAKSRASWLWLSLALLVAAVALGWPQIEQQLVALGGSCPWPFNALHSASAKAKAEQNVAAADSSELRAFTLEELKKYDGTDPELPILLAIGGKVVDVTSGAKFYAPGKMYHQFAGTACTRALALSSLDKKDITDDVSDLSEDKLKEMEETKLFYYEKYPIVGVLAQNDS